MIQIQEGILFASVDVTPLFDNNTINIEIKDSDLKLMFIVAGAGALKNTTDSVQELPITNKIVVTCQMNVVKFKIVKSFRNT